MHTSQPMITDSASDACPELNVNERKLVSRIAEHTAKVRKAQSNLVSRLMQTPLLLW